MVVKVSAAAGTPDPVATPLPWLDPVLSRAQALAHAHALLLHGALGDGLVECAQRIVSQWLCEAPPQRSSPCGECESCRLLAGGVHPDLFCLLPEEWLLRLGLPLPDGAAGERSDAAGGKRKPSRQIRIGEVRAAIDWTARTSSRSGAKVVLVHPATAMNLQSASALLKTLEEPPAGVRLLLTAAEPARLLPTVRSRCQVLRLTPPAAGVAMDWLRAQGLAEPATLLAACSGRPLDARDLAAAGLDAARWQALPAAVLQRQSGALGSLPLPTLIDVLQKICHDGLILAAGASPRFFPEAALAAPAASEALALWSRELARIARHADHPWHEGLLVDSLLARTASAWQGRFDP